MKKTLMIVTLLSSYSTFSSEIIADLQYVCSRVDQTQNSDIKPLSIYNASIFFNKQKVIVSDYGSLIETSYKRIKKGIVLEYYSGYVNDNKLTISFSGEFPSSLTVGARNIEMDCVSN